MIIKGSELLAYIRIDFANGGRDGLRLSRYCRPVVFSL
uniref:Uncharacterized protein n=1 Tax=Physcomitrium patens TaxID=3218 RepID=A0A2K1KNG6_PHYPA|nr:hypothetical protein PHYPA_006212 [Physcomitrium patens]